MKGILSGPHTVNANKGKEFSVTDQSTQKTAATSHSTAGYFEPTVQTIGNLRAWNTVYFSVCTEIGEGKMSKQQKHNKGWLFI